MVHIEKKKKISKKKNPTWATDYEYVDSNYWWHSDHHGQESVPREAGKQKSFQTTSPAGLTCVPAALW